MRGRIASVLPRERRDTRFRVVEFAEAAGLQEFGSGPIRDLLVRI